MLLPLIFTLLTAGPTVAQARPACSGADPAIVSSNVVSATQAGKLEHIVVAGKVQNLGSAGQPGNMLQRVDFYLDGQRTDTRTIQPLAPGAAQNFSFAFDRSAQAGQGTSRVMFVVQVLSPQGTRYNCNPTNGQASMHV